MKIIKVIASTPTQDGDGVNISRVADFSGRLLDPFLMIDELKSDDASDYIGGFPPHPHRGMETFTYIIKGGFEHKDQMGNKKQIGRGDVQWMSTGYGVVHSEMPRADTEGMHGFQIWVNMPAKDKLRPARYQDSVDSILPVLENKSGARIRLLAGQWQLDGQTARSPIGPLAAQAGIADIQMVAGSNANLDLSHAEQVFVYVHSGSINGYSAGHLLLLDAATALEFTADEDGSGALIFTGNKIGEPVAHMGPFVMNTQAELQQAVWDYQASKFGQISV